MKQKKLSIEEEKVLVRKCLDGEKVAWDRFVTLYTKLIYNSIYRALELSGFVLEQDLVEDLHQDVFLAFFKDDFAKLRHFEWKNGSSLATWIAIVARNLVLDYIRKESKKRVVTQSANEPIKEDNDKQWMDTIEDSKSSIKLILNKKENIQMLTKALEELPELDKQLIELLYFQEIPHEDVAKILDKSIDAIYMQKKRVIEKLKGIIEKIS